jgi:hypothetical protein
LSIVNLAQKNIYFGHTRNKVTADRSVWELACWRSLSARGSIESHIALKTNPTQIFAHIPDSDAFIAKLPSSIDRLQQTAMQFLN